MRESNPSRSDGIAQPRSDGIAQPRSDGIAQQLEKPTPGFPLFAHQAGRWATKVNAQLHYFGPWVGGWLGQLGWQARTSGQDSKRRRIAKLERKYSHVRIGYRTPAQLGLLERFHQTLLTEEVYWRMYEHPQHGLGVVGTELVVLPANVTTAWPVTLCCISVGE